MREHPILFSGPMVRAILEGRKSQARELSERWMKVKKGDRLWLRETWATSATKERPARRVAYSADGVCGCWSDDGPDRHFIYHGRCLQAKGYSECFPSAGADTYGIALYGEKWKPSIHMPRWASRITLEATEDARRERLQEISDTDIVREGLPSEMQEERISVVTRGLWWQRLWRSLHTKPGERWESNPMVTVLSFRRVRCQGQI